MISKINALLNGSIYSFGIKSSVFPVQQNGQNLEILLSKIGLETIL
jgi:hypothetical protein